MTRWWTYVLAMTVVVAMLGSIVGCSPGMRQGLGRAYGLADDALRPHLDDLAKAVGDDAASTAVSRVGQRVDDGLAQVVGLGREIPGELRSSFTGVVCQTLAFFVRTGAWPTEDQLTVFAQNELVGLLSAAYNARQVGAAASTVASSIMSQEAVDQKAATEVVCAAAGYTFSV